ncbi:hypothetical protein EVAR_69775_1 [Eumeta japonica]|uniref:Uncharacterized protein n=1 Tax=Eumeta variegata TaxID=151549 RepID=A0A4C2A856_EUMVA|nr:hypothetical protein EVAR_69775_1 [Eumeta japonica]
MGSCWGRGGDSRRAASAPSDMSASHPDSSATTGPAVNRAHGAYAHDGKDVDLRTSGSTSYRNLVVRYVHFRRIVEGKEIER